MIKVRCERYSTGRYMVYTSPPYPRRLGHIEGGRNRWLAEFGLESLGYFRTKKLAAAAIAERAEESVKDRRP
ncbi:MAG: hypothetical protein ACYSSM_07325 [Planctomycetota bacterium]|jgi:hypothetical protein